VNLKLATPKTLQAFCGLSAPAQVVWALIGDFGKPQTWMPGIRQVEMQGRVRTCQTTLGRFRERLIVEGQTRCSYSIEDGPISVENYMAVLSVLPSANSLACQVTWESTFQAKVGADWRALTRKLARIYDTGLRSLQARYGSEDQDPLFRTDGANVSIGIFLMSLKG
jgi:hypothetical protein